jgi:hypothetical protein
MERGSVRWIVLTPVKPDRRADFEAFVQEVIVPTIRQVRPEAMDLWQTLRPAPPEEDGPAVYAFVFFGDHPVEYWYLRPVFDEAYGGEEAARLDEQLDEMLAGEQQVLSFSGEVTPA